jgi:CDP-diacylglycerol---glycerol-3-phosphate 3-phosphatidyltransferase
MEAIRALLNQWWEETCRELVHGLRARGIKPNQVILLGAVVTTLSAPLLAYGWLSLGALVFGIGTLIVALERPLARVSRSSGRTSGLLDTTMDRVSEAIPLAGLAYYLAERGDAQAVAVLVVALLGSFLTSYIRVRAETLGLSCKVGAMTRMERRALMTVLLLIHQPVLMVWVLAIGSGVTALHRYVHVRAQLVARVS